MLFKNVLLQRFRPLYVRRSKIKKYLGKVISIGSPGPTGNDDVKSEKGGRASYQLRWISRLIAAHPDQGHN